MLGKLEEAKILAGGQTLIPTMKLRLASPEATSSTSTRSKACPASSSKGRSIVIGAMTRHVEVATSAVVKENIPALAVPRRPIGDPLVRHGGTHRRLPRQQRSGGRLSGGVLALGATIVTNKRTIPADEFFNGLFETALEPARYHQGQLPARRRRPPTRNSATRLRASRWSACSSPSAAGDPRGGHRRGRNGVFRVKAFEEALKKRFSPKSLEA